MERIVVPEFPHHVTGESASGGTTFVGWEGDLSDKSSPAVITTDADHELTAVFRRLFRVDYTAVNGTVVYSRPQDGTSVYHDPAGPTWGYYYGEGSEIDLIAIPYPGFRFKGWSGDSTGTENPLSITVDEDLSFTPIFEQDRANPMYTWIEVDAEAVEGKGTLSISPVPLNSFNEYDTAGHVSSTWYRYNRSTLSQATVSFTPASGTAWSVREWRYTVGLPPGPEQVSTSAAVSVPLDQEAHVRPVLGYRLRVNIEGDGAIHFGDPGTVYDTSPVVMDFPASEAVSVYAVPDAGSALVSWLGDAAGTVNPLPLTMNADKNLTAVFSTAFDAGDVNLNVTVLGEGEIRVNTVPVTDSRRFVFDDDTQVQLEAVPVAGYDFIGWGGHLSGTTTTQDLLLDTSKSVSALFVPTGTTPGSPNSVYVMIQGNGNVLLGSFVESDTATFLVAKPQFAWRFVHWLVNGEVVEGKHPRALAREAVPPSGWWGGVLLWRTLARGDAFVGTRTLHGPFTDGHGSGAWVPAAASWARALLRTHCRYVEDHPQVLAHFRVPPSGL